MKTLAEPNKPIAKEIDPARFNAARFWSHVDKADAEECWLWTAATDAEGYAVWSAAGESWRANRIAFALAYYPPPVDRMVCHTCDNPQCVKPSHLVLGTGVENMRDSSNKGRASGCRGPREGASRSWLTLAEEIRAIGLVLQGMDDPTIAREMNVAVLAVKKARGKYPRSMGGNRPEAIPKRITCR